MASLLIDCQNCFEKGNESWKSYFSKWEILAKHEEDIPESELNEKWNENFFLTLENNKGKKKRSLPQRKPSTVSLSTNKMGLSKGKRKVIKKKKITRKNKQKEEMQSKNEGNEIVPEQMDNEQLEMNLRTILMNILKANKNKWEIFSVLSQTFSHGDSTVKGSLPLIQNQHLALTSNDIKLDNITLSVRSQQVFSLPIPRVNLIDGAIIEQRSPHIDCSSFQMNRYVENSPLQPFSNRLWTKVSLARTQAVDDSPGRFRICYNDFNDQMIYSRRTPTPPQSFKMGSRILKSCPASLSNFLRHRRNHTLRPQALEFGSKFPALEYNEKIKDEYIKKGNHDRGRTQEVPQVSGSWDDKKSFQSLCSHKRTNDVCLNKENSNFITPERKPTKRKCFSENISQRKRRRSSKLFFDNEDEEDSDDDGRIEKRSPLIRWEDKKIKTLLAREDSDSDEPESIFDRVKKP